MDAVVKRSGEILARYGGEEFVAVLPNVNLEGAKQVAQSMRAAVLEMNIEHRCSKTEQQVTVSLGLASGIPDTSSAPADLVASADQALYEAKSKGRNCICYKLLGAPSKRSSTMATAHLTDR